MFSLNDPWALFEKSLEDNAARCAVVAGANRISYRELHGAARALSARLGERCAPQASVAVLLGMLPEYLVAELAILHTNTVKVPLNPMLSDAEMGYIIEHSGARILLVSPLLDEDSLRKVEQIRRRDPGLLVMDVHAEDTSAGVEVTPAAAVPGDRAAIYYTGGTTGTPKGVVHSRASMAANFLAHVVQAEITGRDRVLLSTSLSHSAGSFAAAALLQGAQIILMDRFSPEAFGEVGRREGATFAMVVPTMLYRLLDHAAAGGTLPELSTLVYGSAPVTPSRLLEAVRVFGPVLIQLFGQTECPNWGTALTKRDHELALTRAEILSSCGKRGLFADVKIVDEEGRALGPGQTGEICLSAPFTMSGYLDNPEATAETLIDGWIHTRDIGQWDESGYLYIKDRKSDMIISGGYNVYSSEVEAEIQKIPGVSQVAVFGVPDADWGEAVCAFVRPRDGVELSAEFVTAESRELLGSYKRPKLVRIVDNIPLTPFGKADKKALRAPFWADQTRAV